MLMSNKIALLMFATTVLLASTVIMTIPQANALTLRNNMSDNIVMVRHTSYAVCGDHKCAPGEHNQWFVALTQFQKIGQGTVGTGLHGEDIISKLVNSTSTSTTMSGNNMMSGNMKMSGSNMTMSGNNMMSGNMTMSGNNMMYPKTK